MKFENTQIELCSKHGVGARRHEVDARRHRQMVPQGRRGHENTVGGKDSTSLREFVLRTTVILTPGACGREVPSGSPWTGSAGSAGSAGIRGWVHFCAFLA